MRKRGLAVPVLVALTVALTVSVSGCGIGVHFGDYRHRLTADAQISGPVKVVDVGSDRGHVNVTTGSGSGVRIHRVVRYEGGAPHPGQRLDGGTLTFTADCTRCAVDYDLTVPASVTVRARSDSGAVDVAGVASADAESDSGSVVVRSVNGPVRAHGNSGNVSVRDVSGALDLRNDSGAISATGLRSATVHATNDSGAVRLEFAAAPTEVRAVTDSGSLHVVVPGGPYDVKADSDSGDRDVSRVRHDVSAPRRLFLRTDSGKLTAEPI